MKNIIIVGSGAGGATVAKELAKSGVLVTVIEKGPLTVPKKAYKHYEISKTGVELLKNACIGGTTLVAAGNAVRICEKTLKKMKIDLENEFKEVEQELNVKTLPDSHFGSGTKKIMESAKSLDIEIKKMPKFIEPDLCDPCGKCAFGCPKDAKWTATDFINDAKKNGAKIVEKTLVTDIIVSNGQVNGVKCDDKIFQADIVILASGAIETPRLLRKISISAGDNLFVDTFVTVGGILKGIKFNKEVSMNALIEFDDFIIAPHFSDILVNKLKKFKAKKKDILGMMVKIKDEPSGKVRENKVVKYNTAKDVELLAEGSAIAGAILTEAGVNPNTLVSTYARGAHPGGTAAIGDIVDKNLETSIEGLFVADASVLPEPPGAPPILTIIALAKRLSKYLVNERT